MRAFQGEEGGVLLKMPDTFAVIAAFTRWSAGKPWWLLVIAEKWLRAAFIAGAEWDSRRK